MSSSPFTTAQGPLHVHCVGVQFRDVSSRIRDSVALSQDEVSVALAGIAQVMPAAEAVVLATCNRTELYVVEAGDPGALDLWHRTIGRQEVLGQCPAPPTHRYHLVGRDAAEHLFRVVAGLESDELGDNEIVGQVRRARERAVEAGTVGPVLHRLFDMAGRVGRRARAETSISSGGAGVGLAVASTVVADIEVGATPSEPVVTVLGAGDAAHAVCRELRKRVSAGLTIVNRSRERAAALADVHGAVVHDLDAADRALAGADVVVVAARGDEPLFSGALVAAVREDDPGWNPLVIDVCVPAGVAPGAGVRVATLDDPAERHDAVHDSRRSAIPAVETIVAEQTVAFGNWLDDRAMADVIAALHREADAVTRAVAGVVDDDHIVRQVRRVMRRYVHDQLVNLRSLQGEVPDSVRPEKEEVQR